jgi:hypothetical protein
MYRYLRRYLQLLSYRYRPESHWVLKAPLHALYPRALLREFPDARIIHTHRDPRDIVASWTKFQFQMVRCVPAATHRGMYTYTKDTHTHTERDRGAVIDT